MLSVVLGLYLMTVAKLDDITEEGFGVGGRDADMVGRLTAQCRRYGCVSARPYWRTDEKSSSLC